MRANIGAALLFVALGLGVVIAAAAPLVAIEGGALWIWPAMAVLVTLLVAGALLKLRGR